MTDDEIRQLISDGYERISSKHRLVSRLPEGMTAIEAVSRHDPNFERNVREQIERRAASTYRRVYAQADGNVLELSADDFAAFRGAGGISSW